MVRRFITALTRGGPNGIPRPIEMHAHDPVRYTGDMLAWIHQAVASENEFLKALFDGDLEFGDDEPSNQVPTPIINSEISSNSEGTSTFRGKSMVGRVFEGVARPLKVKPH